jgi:hypothetical protein
MAAKASISLVHIGVKSSGCEKSTTHLPAKSDRLIVPKVESALKSGACSPMRGKQGTFSKMHGVV